jgi:hypothetical protein
MKTIYNLSTADHKTEIFTRDFSITKQKFHIFDSEYL